MMLQLDLSVGILAWHSGQTLINSLESYKKHGLLDIVRHVTIFFQEVTDEDIQIAKDFGIPYIGTTENIGIGPGFIQLAENAESDHVLLLEHDWELCENKSITTKRLRMALDLLNNGYHSIRLRHRRNPGFPLYTLQEYPGKELEHYDSSIGLMSPHLLDCIHWIEDPDQVFPDKIQKNGEFFTSTSRWSNFTNNPCLYKKQFYIDAVTQFADSGLLLEHYGISRWWADQKFNIAYGEGLFTHNDIQKYT